MKKIIVDKFYDCQFCKFGTIGGSICKRCEVGEYFEPHDQDDVVEYIERYERKGFFNDYE